MDSIRNFLKGKKTYITAVVGLLGIAIAWADGGMTGLQALGAAWVALQACFIRAGVATEIAKAVSQNT